MRLVPDSIAGRTTAILVAGTLAILAAGAIVTSFGVFEEAAPRRNARLMERAVMLVSVLNAVPAEARADVIESVRLRGMRLRWTAEAPPTPAVAHDWFSLWAERRLRRALGRFDVGRVLVGHEPSGGPGDAGVAPVHRGRAIMWIEFGDGTWLNIAPARAWHSGSSLGYFALMVVIVGGGLTGLAVFVARWVTAPLGRFASASARLGHDVDAPPLGEAGPAEIRRAAKAFNQMQRRIRRFMDERMHMLAAASHDLRTPITRLRLRAELIEDVELRAKTLKDLDEMEAVISSTIAFAREETTSEPATPVDLARLVQEIRADLAEAGHSVKVEGSAQLVYEGRATALKRALANLIGNAVIYGGGTAVVSLSEADARVTITIKDSGPGIPEAEREQVFAPFYRLERSRSRETGGAGLGLSVARTVIRAHGGEITLANRPEGGLLQEVVLPRGE